MRMVVDAWCVVAPVVGGTMAVKATRSLDKAKTLCVPAPLCTGFGHPHASNASNDVGETSQNIS